MADNAAQRQSLEHETRRLDAETSAMVAEGRALAPGFMRPPPPPQPSVGDSPWSGAPEHDAGSALWAGNREGTGEWDPRTLRNLLLVLGVGLVAIAAVVFAVVAWPRLDDMGRGLVLVGASSATLVLALWARPRLPATGEALSVLFLAFAAVDWLALRRGGVGEDLGVVSWWALGAVVVGALGALLFAVGFRSPGAVFPVAGVIAGTLAISANVDSLADAAPMLAVLATLSVLVASGLNRVSGWQLPAVVFVVGAAVVEAVAAIGTIDALGDPTSSSSWATYSVLSLGMAPLVGRIAAAGQMREEVADGLVGLVTPTLIGGVVVAASSSLGGLWLVALTAGCGAASVVVARVGGTVLRRGVSAAAAVTVAVPAAVLLWVGGAALLLPWSWTSATWTGDLTATAATQITPDHATGDASPLETAAPLMVTAAILAATIVLAALPRLRTLHRLGEPLIPERAAGAGGLAVGVVGVVLLPLFAQASVAVTIGVYLGAAGAAAGAALALGRSGRRGQVLLALAAVLFAVPAAGWALVAEPSTLLVYAGLAALGAVMAGYHPNVEVRGTAAMVATGCAAVTAGSACSALDQPAAVVGVAVAAVGAASLVTGGVFARHTPLARPLEIAAWGALVVGLVLSTEDLWWFGLALVLTAAGCAATAVYSAARGLYAWLAAATATGATWAWLGAAQIQTLEAYTLPAAAYITAAGFWARSGTGTTTSWRAYGPGLLLALGPTTAWAIIADDPYRAIGAAVGATLILTVGVTAQLKAPVVLGAVALALLGLDILWPAAALLPRWITLGAAGVLLLWLGATIERRRTQIHDLAASLDRFT